MQNKMTAPLTRISNSAVCKFSKVNMSGLLCITSVFGSKYIHVAISCPQNPSPKKMALI